MWPFATQKATYCIVKGRLLDSKRRPFTFGFISFCDTPDYQRLINPVQLTLKFMFLQTVFHGAQRSRRHVHDVLYFGVVHSVCL